MSIKSFVEASKILYENNKYEEALCLVCIAIDAYSSELDPTKNVSKRYKLFLRNNFNTICKYGFPGIEANSIRIKVIPDIESLKKDEDGFVDMEQIIYHTIRCGLVHNCDIEKMIEFVDRTSIGSVNGDKFNMPKTIIHGLLATLSTLC